MRGRRRRRRRRRKRRKEEEEEEEEREEWLIGPSSEDYKWHSEETCTLVWLAKAQIHREHELRWSGSR